MKVNEIFYSIQGEGCFAGTPAIFLRLSGCNLKCSFCDTKHKEGQEMTLAEVINELSKYPAEHVVITGGEPSLQLDIDFIDYLHERGFFVQVETNGVKRLPMNVDWVTCSPKYKPICYKVVDEIKLVYEGKATESKIEKLYNNVTAKCYYLQPCDTQDAERNAEILNNCIEYIKNNPQWKLSLQTHKIINVR